MGPRSHLVTTARNIPFEMCGTGLPSGAKASGTPTPGIATRRRASAPAARRGRASRRDRHAARRRTAARPGNLSAGGRTVGGWRTSRRSTQANTADSPSSMAIRSGSGSMDRQSPAGTTVVGPCRCARTPLAPRAYAASPGLCLPSPADARPRPGGSKDHRTNITAAAPAPCRGSCRRRGPRSASIPAPAPCRCSAHAGSANDARRAAGRAGNA